ncbi:putative ankyrin repeat protein RF_0381 [Cloeon dipterum]|uniref:putative ankyrin repeat protein RF_0381 n=1 Tax=Cloeon dipterum TaxID=197152 RepID=UPI00321FC2D5
MESTKKNPKRAVQAPDSESEKRLEFNELTRLDEKLNFIEKNRGKIPRILFAAKYADEEVCRQLIADGADVSKILDRNGANAFHYVGMNPSGSKLVELFHEHGTKIDKKAKNGKLPLARALKMRNFEVSLKLFELLKQKINFNGNILDWCIDKNALYFCKFVFEKDASLSKAKTENLLIRAVRRADQKLCQWLFKECLADVDLDSDQTSNWKEEILFDVASNLKHGEKIAHFLLENYKIDVEKKSLFFHHTPYSHAIAMENRGVANALLIHGAILEVDIDPKTARQIYRGKGYKEKIRELSRILSSHIENFGKGKNLLQVALELKFIHAAEALFELNFDKKMNKINYLHFCVEKNNLESAKLVHSRNKDLMKEMGQDGKYVLHLAAERADLDMCRWLLSQGADPEALTSDGRSVLDFAARQEVKDYFQSVQMSKEIRNASKKRFVDVKIGHV